MVQRRWLYVGLFVAMLGIGVIIGSLSSDRATATGQKAGSLAVPDPVQLSSAFAQIAKRVEPAVVNINTEGAVEPAANPRGREEPFDFFDFFGRSPNQPQRVTSLGSGVIVDKAGYILTNHHVIDKATKIRVTLDDKREFVARVIGSDPDTDIAVIKIEVGGDLPFAKMGNSDAMSPGDWVLAIGSPFGFEQTLTAGIVSAKNRGQVPGSTQFQNFLQTDAAINPGNSGGPLVNMAGEVVGINTAIISGNRQFAGVGFALPSNTAVSIYNQLINGGKVTRGSIGIQYNPDPDPGLFRAFGLKAGRGVFVDFVIRGGPADQAGLKAADIITEIDGKPVASGSELVDIVANTPLGKSIRVKFIREGREQTASVVIGDRAKVIGDQTRNTPERPGEEAMPARLGLRVQDLTPQVVRQLGLTSSEGVLIAEVDSGGLGAEAGLARGMVITRLIANNQRNDINNVDDFRRAERSLRSGTDIALMVLIRDPQSGEYRSRFVPLTIP